LGRSSFRRTIVCVHTHLLFREDQCALLLAFVAPLQEFAAQQREFLHANAVSPNQGKIGPDRKLRPRSVRLNALKCEHAESHIWSEPRDNELHLRELHLRLLTEIFFDSFAVPASPFMGTATNAGYKSARIREPGDPVGQVAPRDRKPQRQTPLAVVS
jgi:hypothetical protein